MIMEYNLKLSYEDLSEVINITAASFVRRYGRVMEFEEVVQELWVCMCEKDLDSKQLAFAIARNRAYDLLRKNLRTIGKEDNYDFRTEMMSDEDRDWDNLVMDFRVSNKMISDSMYESVEDEVVLHDFVLGIEREYGTRTYILAVAKAYLTDGISYLENEYNKIFNELPAERKQMLYDADKCYTIDTIAKVFLGVRTGTNAGSVRKCIAELKRYFGTGLGVAIR